MEYVPVNFTEEEERIATCNVGQIIDEINAEEDIKFAAITAGHFCWSKLHVLYKLPSWRKYGDVFSTYTGALNERICEILKYIATENSMRMYDLTLFLLYTEICEFLDNCMDEDELEQEQTVSDKARLLIEIIGSTGMFGKKDIYAEFNALCIKRELAEGNLTDGFCLHYMNRLIKDGFIKPEKLRLPFNNQFTVYTLTDRGKDEYCRAYGKPPVEPLYAPYKRENDNLIHALGIWELEQILNKSREFFFVSCKRKDTTIPLLNGTSYIPDAITKGRLSGRQEPRIMVFEYELDKHTTKGLKDKLNHAVKAVRQLEPDERFRCINIVTNNYENAGKMRMEVDEWISDYGSISLMDIRLRITTLVCLRDAVNRNGLINNDKNWIFIYNFSKGVKYTKNKPLVTFNQTKG